ncbi:unnamed protein product [Sphenostylis stenocarpa]|uniref:Uncharacterized protein n=1 Tax=Sphenostylis stenocarpa TaxID=92480 RepID=A0AA86SYW0_9FABA|nr:unnamed protein product [Sphenostylis stenocarpa]
MTENTHLKELQAKVHKAFEAINRQTQSNSAIQQSLTQIISSLDCLMVGLPSGASNLSRGVASKSLISDAVLLDCFLGGLNKTSQAPTTFD